MPRKRVRDRNTFTLEKICSNIHHMATEQQERFDRPVVALVTGATGQVGSYLVELLLAMKEPQYIVHGLIRRSSSFNTGRLDAVYVDPHQKDARLHLHYGDLTDASGLQMLVAQIRPDEVYNLAAQSHVAVSFAQPVYTSDVDALGTLRLLEAIRACPGLEKTCRFYQASTSELYGAVADQKEQEEQQQPRAQSESTPFNPVSPYACAKLFAFWMVKTYRRAYGMFAVNGIIFNCESPRRGETFVTRKITRAVAAISQGRQDCLYLGNLDAQRDWGSARDHARAIWLMVHEAKTPSDWVVSTGETHTVREFVEKAFAAVGIKIGWQGQGVDEVGVQLGVDDGALRVLVRIDPRYLRPAEVPFLLGDSSRIRRDLGWKPTVTFDALVKEMVSADLHKTCAR